MAPVRGAEANACGILGRTRTLTEWRSGFNRYRRTWAGPELTTEPDASWRRTGAAKRDIPYHDVSFPFSRMSGNVRVAYASHYPIHIYWESPIGGQRQLPALYITCTQQFPYCRRGVPRVLGIDNVAGTQKVPREEHVMKRRGHGAQEWWEGTREEVSLTRYSIVKDGSPMLGQAGQLVVSNTGASRCTYSDNVYD